MNNYSGYSANTKNKIMSGIQNTQKFANSNGKVNNMIANATNNALKNSPYYNQYLGWRNA